MSDFEKEKQHLDEVIQKTKKEIEKAKADLANLVKIGTKLSFEDRQRGEHFNVNSKADMASRKISTLTRSIPIPYFGRMDLKLEGEDERQELYIGRVGISSEGKTLVTDWRAPVSSLYYDSEVGDVSYTAPDGKIDGELYLKRQINIKDSKLLDMQDSSLVTNDELLKPYLSENADNKMKTIIASIQKEQNDIIRKPSNKNLIIQGVAGSGKTSVALHRIAYLVYELGDKISSDEFLVLGPNDYFLNYVSTILPDLETQPVSEETYLKFANEYLGTKLTLREDDSKSDKKTRMIQKYKTSMEYKKVLDEFLDDYIKNSLVLDDFKIMDEVIFTKKEVMNCLFSLNPNIPNYDRVTQLLSASLKNNLTEHYDKVNKKYKDIYKNMPFDDPERKRLVEHSTLLYKEMKENGTKLIKKYVKSIQLSAINIYALFIDYLSNCDLPIDEKDKLLLQKETLVDIKKKKLGFEDIPSLLHIQYRLNQKTYDYKQVIIDEAQDYGLFHFYVLKEINPSAKFAIYGDLAQAIYSYRSIDSWDSINENIFNNECEFLTLSKSYRTTIEITKNANLVLDHLHLTEANPVIRHGESVSFDNTIKDINEKVKRIKEFQTKGYQTIALICKTEKEAKMISSKLEECGLNPKYINNKDDKYEGGLFVLTSSSAKGLEFDAVIINDASTNVYDEKSDVDMHLLYVACTRALHELVIGYNGEILDIFKEYTNDNEKKLVMKR